MNNSVLRPKSQKIYEQMCQMIPGGVNSPVRAWKEIGIGPMVIDHAHGDILTDCDGNQFVDFCCSWGALIHGHANEFILQPVIQRMSKGTSFGITSPVEGKLAKKIIDLVPSIEKIRFVSSGTEATMSAIRLARGFTHKKFIVKFSGNYHGHADYFLVQAGSGVSFLPNSTSKGIPEELIQHTLCLPYNDEKAIRDLFMDSRYNNNIAAVILEPIAGNMGVVPASQSFIKTLREETLIHNALLIFDEVITGFRIGLNGAQGYYSIAPDLTCLGKIIGGGLPAAAFGGKKEIMDNLAPLGSVYQAGTLSGNPIAMEAGLQALSLLEQKNFYSDLEEKTRVLTDPIVDYIEKNKINACLQRVGSMFTLFFGRSHINNMEEARNVDSQAFVKLFCYLFENGIYIPPSPHEAWFVSAAHEPKNLKITSELILKFLLSY